MIAVIWSMVRARRAHALTVALLATLAIGAAVAAPVFLDAASASVVARAIEHTPPRDQLLSATETVQVATAPYGPDLVGATPRGFDRAAQQALDLPGFASVLSARIRVLAGQRPPTDDEIRDASPIEAVYRQDFCEHVSLTAGRCVSGTREVMLTPTLAGTLGLSVGDSFLVTPMELTPADPRARRRFGERNGPSTQVTVVALYTVTDPDDLYWGAQAGPPMRDAASLPIVTDRAGLTAIAHNIEDQSAIAYALPGTLGVDRLDQVAAAVTAAAKRGQTVNMSSGLPVVISGIQRDLRALPMAPIIGAALLIMLCWFVIFLAVAQTAQVRRIELGAMKLRGLTSPDQWWLVAAETVLPLAVGAVAGYVLAHVAVWLAVDDTGRAAIDTGAGALPFALIAFGGSLLAGLGAVRRTLATPAVELLRRVPARHMRWEAVAVMAIPVVIATVAVVQARSAADGPDGRTGLVLLAPALAILAASLLAAVAFDWLLGVAGTALLRRGRLSLGLGALRMGRRQSGSRLVALLTVAVALLGFASLATSIAADRRQRQVDVAIGASRVLQVGQITPFALQDAVHGVDPTGSFAAAMVPITSTKPSVLAVDAQGLAAASLWPSANASSAADVAALLRAEPLRDPVVYAGKTMRLTATVIMPSGAEFDLDSSLMPLNGKQPARYTLHLEPGTHTYDVRLDCSAGCRVGAFALSFFPGASTGDLSDASITFREIRQVAPDAVIVSPEQFGGWLNHGGVSLATKPVADGLEVTFPGRPNGALSRIAPPDTPENVAVVAAGALDSFSLPASTGAAIPTQQKSILDLVPRLGAGGLIDLGRLVRIDDAMGQVGNAEVWLSAQAPADVVARLKAAGLTILGERTQTAELADAEHRPSAVGLGFLIAVAAIGIVLAVAGLSVSAGVERPAWAEELRALRAQGLRRRVAIGSALVSYLATILAAVVLGGLIARGVWALTGAVVPTIEGPVPGADRIGFAATPTVVAWLGAGVVLVAVGVLLASALVRAAARHPRERAAARADVISRAEFATPTR
jgi:hypothetical protein